MALKYLFFTKCLRSFDEGVFFDDAEKTCPLQWLLRNSISDIKEHLESSDFSSQVQVSVVRGGQTLFILSIATGASRENQALDGSVDRWGVDEGPAGIRAILRVPKITDSLGGGLTQTVAGDLPSGVRTLFIF